MQNRSALPTTKIRFTMNLINLLNNILHVFSILLIVFFYIIPYLHSDCIFHFGLLWLYFRRFEVTVIDIES